MISNFLNNKSVWKIIYLYSYSPGAGFLRKDILNLTKLNNLSLDLALGRLFFENILIKKGRIIKLNFDNEKTEKLLELINIEKKNLNFINYDLLITLNEFLDNCSLLKIDKIILFGSHAKKTASIGSDIDLAVVCDKKIRKELMEIQDKVERKFNAKFQLHFFDLHEFKKNMPLVKNIAKDGIVLKE